MTHARAIAHLLALAAPEKDARRPAPAEREALTAHVARCSDCWQALARLHGEVTDGGGEDAEMAARFGCDAVRDRLFALVDLDPAAIARDHAAEARHLGWCLACRTRLAELIDVERELARTPRWIEVADRVREAAGRLVVRAGRAAAGLLEVPDGFALGPSVLPVPARGAGPVVAVTPSASFDLGDTGVSAEITVEPGDALDAGFSLRVTSAAGVPLSLHVREVRSDGDALVARYSLHGTEPVAVRGLWPGSFMLELHGARDASIHRVRLDVGPAA